MPKILVCEDDLLTQQLMQFKLRQQGFTVLAAADGGVALDLARSEKPDLIILDWMMPVRDGYEVLRQLKEHPDLKKIPVIMLTSRSKDCDIARTLEMGAADYMIKPFSPMELMARIKKVFATQKPDSDAGTSEPGK